ncbi:MULTISPECIES: tRNA (uridine(34)/cytosine(34)/5-carboxymethylaminomethyluridine(34)-2'-O)-methyltransferase TrmL [Alteromonadaceae]|uniref:tRNA (uridine(34)/cytosine(34)/5- carboxymethylaminomethyluridine(34)-2'-O)- methyltransferase TrmL n=1 Tax=Alteromonadaceae TaxID=72275 RepID=UPI001C090CD6|nr:MULTISPECIES: tRNA (uridine(34)/cytosine(34)/5-carboxymethylaminomethyluridine(34)-2'-O)-methyltransferase TrmL [Aliiglaciecola]MBU2878511.1 tRNA (uridine(34)/cytosine(34)/5-carboxymethylaminomethyluridine(34)-2'-O)-methyltransferase TrmL [Aliiglaciecola lipolytica]MDO6709661.1 tRNA (uridine(34)/cytosine(34)/5-carboxymethylaminomethyluridine(34)-2'-O)-methyltransferase TrmL [Aliiglaciecola sp. 2_MG-2023]MDO6750797.1 tRNA (uridine(34)/cytosine(34)/5-carboxymethylaminomethyluridine(34)-2'-O)-me
MLSIVLYQPEIPPNTGNIIRLCANTGYDLHLIEPLGFDWDDKKVRRAGLDYHEFAEVKRHADLTAYLQSEKPQRVFACTTKGTKNFADADFKLGDALLFGPETRGLPDEVIQNLPAEQRLRIPMLAKSRSMNLSNAVSVFVYESWRQLGFEGAV